MDKKKSTGLLLSILGVISLVLITAGVTYAFFSYTKEGQTVNRISTASILFRYDETGNALNITNALPTADSTGIAKTTGNGVTEENFTFTVTSQTPAKAKIPYVVTVAKDATSTLDEDQVKLYLSTTSTVDDETNSEVGNKTLDSNSVVRTYSELPVRTDFANDGAFSWIQTNQKIIYAGIVPVNSGNYVRTFKLGMWVKDVAPTDPSVDYSAYEFIKKSALSGTTPASVDTLKGTAGNIYTSSEYFRRINLETTDTDYINPDDYTRIAFVNYVDGTVIGVSQGVTTAPSASFEASEQFYPFNGKTFKVTVNVYAEGTTVYNN